MSAPKGNRYAAKPARERRESRLNIPVTRAEKAALVNRAKGSKLADYVRGQLGLNVTDQTRAAARGKSS